MKTHPYPTFRFIRTFPPILAALLVFLSHGANAANRFWNVADGNWNVDTNWNPSTVPGTGDTAIVDNSGLLNITDTQAAQAVHVGHSVTTITMPGIDNRMIIASTGTLTTTLASRVAFSANTVGTVTVNGTWNAGGPEFWAAGSGLADFTIGETGTVAITASFRMGSANGAVGVLTINPGGNLSNTNASVAVEAGSTSTVEVSGTWTSSADFLDIGNSGTGNLLINDGGAVSLQAGAFRVGRFAGSSGDVLVRGTLNTPNGEFSIGRSGSGTLTIGDGGVVNANSGAGLVQLASASTSASGVLTIGGRVNGVTPAAAEGAGILNAAEVRGRASGGTSTLNFNHTGADYHFTTTGLSGGANILISGATTTVNVYAGKTTLSGANTYGGGTTINGGTLKVAGGGLTATSGINLNGGTLLLGASNVLNNAAAVNFNGGTFATGGFSEGAATTVGLGTLTLSENSTLDFGTGTVGTVTFAGGAFTAGTLAITNWSGTAGAEGTDGINDRLIFAGTDAARLAFQSAFSQSSISFNGVSGFKAVQFDDNYFELVAIPEPSTVLAALVLFGVTGCTRRASRRRA